MRMIDVGIYAEPSKNCPDPTNFLTPPYRLRTIVNIFKLSSEVIIRRQMNVIIEVEVVQSNGNRI